MKKLLAFAFLTIFTAQSHAGLVKLSASGSANSSDFNIVVAPPTCCESELSTYDWEFTSIFNFEDFYNPDYMEGYPSFILSSHDSTATVNGVSAPASFNQNTWLSGQRHVIESYAFGDQVLTQFEISMGVSYEQSSRFMISDNFYLREFSISGYLIGLYDSLDEAKDPSKAFFALQNNPSAFDINYRFFVGDANNPDDNIARGSFRLKSIDEFKIEPVSVSEPVNLTLLLIGLAGLWIARSRSSYAK